MKKIMIVLVVVLLFNSITYGVQNVDGNQLKTFDEFKQDIEKLLDNNMLVNIALVGTIVGLGIQASGVNKVKLYGKCLKYFK